MKFQVPVLVSLKFGGYICGVFRSPDTTQTPPPMSEHIAHEEWKRMRCITLLQKTTGPVGNGSVSTYAAVVVVVVVVVKR